MEHYIISKERLMRHLHEINAGKMPGVYDWFVGEGNVLHVMLFVSGVKYVYRQSFDSNGEIDSDLRMSISRQNEVLGIIGLEDYKEPVLETVTMEDFSGVNVKDAYRH